MQKAPKQDPDELELAIITSLAARIRSSILMSAMTKMELFITGALLIDKRPFSLWFVFASRVHDQ